jgi:hypothetical protein
MARPVRIANCSGFYGDRLSAAREQLEGGPIDVLTGDWLAELTMMILAMDRLATPGSGYARTFLGQMQDVLPLVLERRVRVVSNAGGLAPGALAEAVRAAAARLGLAPRIAVITGDDLSDRLPTWMKDGRPLLHADTGEPLAGAGQPLTANAYLGATAIRRALELGADVVITGRVTDAALVMGPAAWWHAWAPDAWDAYAGALVAGHVIECGCQATGGNFSFWTEVDLDRRPGFPIAEIAADGSSVITKHPGTGGLVSVETVTAQLLYEIGPPSYVSPDAIAHFDTVRLTQDGPDRVQITGAVGSPPPDTLKLGVTLATGHVNSMTALLGGSDAAQKAEALERAAWAAVGGKDRFQHARADLFLAAADEPLTPGASLSTLTFSVRDRDARKVGGAFTGPLVELALAHVPGLTYTTPPQKPRPVGMFWPVIIPRDEVTTTVRFEGRDEVVPPPPTGPLRHVQRVQAARSAEVGPNVRLGELCGGRSGDKGGNANVGFWARDPAHLPWMLATLTEARVRDWLAPAGFTGRVERFELPNLNAVNFVLHGWLDTGVAANLAPDPQAKCLADFFRAQRVPGPSTDVIR